MNGKSVSTVALFGLPISNVSMAEAVERIAEGIEDGTTQQIATANLDFARNARKNSFLQQVICDCSLVLPDGVPMLWAITSYFNPAPFKNRLANYRTFRKHLAAPLLAVASAGRPWSSQAETARSAGIPTGTVRSLSPLPRTRTVLRAWSKLSAVRPHSSLTRMPVA